MAYAMACVEVVANNSEPAGKIYKDIIENWGKPGIKESFEKFISKIPESEKEGWKSNLKHPELVIKKDVNEPWQDFVSLLNEPDFENMLSEGIWKITPETLEAKHKEVWNLFSLIIEFIVVGFNRDSEQVKGKYKVFPSFNPPWLILAVMQRTAFESHQITLDRLQKIYKVRKVKGKIYDFEEVLTQQPMGYMHRQIAKSRQGKNMKLKHDSNLLDSAWIWYQCRIVNSNIEEFLDKEMVKGNDKLDLKNVQKEVKLCDDAIGYQRRKRKISM